VTTISNLRELKARISVFGVGGAGGNAVNNMITAGLQGVEFVVAKTYVNHVRFWG
jgi:cell division protein FtsZ